MRLLLDTHIFIWAFLGDSKLPSQAAYMINQDDNEILCSVATIWEVSIKHTQHPDKFTLTSDKMIQLCNDNGIYQLPLYFRHIAALNSLQRNIDAPEHKDPFDRIMLAQAKTDNLCFITHDKILTYYNEPCLFYV